MSANMEARSRVADVIEHARSKGVRLWADNGALRYSAPKGAMTPADVDLLRLSRAELLEHLAQHSSSDFSVPVRAAGMRDRPFPLAYPQLTHLNWLRTTGSAAVRAVAYAGRLRGPLDVGAMRDCVAAMVSRHEALRTRVLVISAEPVQLIHESGDTELEVEDVRAWEGAPDEEVRRRLAEYILEPVDMATDSLFSAKLFRVSGSEHILLLSMDHLISDGFSLSILLREFFAAYAQLSSGGAISLPSISVQLADYAQWQRNTCESWLQQHALYWKEHMAEAQRVRFPADNESSDGALAGWTSNTVNLGRKRTAALRKWSRERRTTVAMSAFCAYVATAMRWCQAATLVVGYQANGRISGLENTIGYFASPLYLRIELIERDTFADLLVRATAEYCAANDHADFGYFEARTPPPAFVANTAFNWVPQARDEALCEGQQLSLSSVPVLDLTLGKLQWDHEPSVLLFDRGDEISGSIHFSRQRFSSARMERFCHAFLGMIDAMLQNPRQRINDVPQR